MAAISFERYCGILKPSLADRINPKLMLIACVLASFFWSGMPLLGWSHFALEDGKTGCCIEYRERSFNVISYNVAILIFVFTIPFGFVIGSNVHLFFIVSANNLNERFFIK